MDVTLLDVKYLQGVGPQRAALLQKELDVRSVGDLLHYFPYKHIDRSRIYTVAELTADMPYVQVRGQIVGFEQSGQGRATRLIAHFTDGTGFIDLVWFQGLKYVTSQYRVREEYIVFGRPTIYNQRIQLAHPDVEKASAPQPAAPAVRPCYNTTERMKRSFLNSQAMEKMMLRAVQLLPATLPETLTPDILNRHRLMPLADALRNAHFPQSADALHRAQLRLKFEELFYVQLNILRYAHDRRRKCRGYAFARVGALFNTFYSQHLPFSLTEAQKRVLREIRADVGSGRQMNRLLQGDVGSGKTMVALMTTLLALDNGYQACLMAPTEILARQHYDTLVRQLEGMPVRVELLTGTVKGKRRQLILDALAGNEVHILIGTHALIEESVVFAQLGLAVIDEQHRFGVVQRARLWQKSLQPPHVLVMTATPIPRTLAMTLYGDLDVSVIDELPPGRKPVATIHQFDNRREQIHAFIRRQTDAGRQVYVVYPLVKESEKIDLKNLQEGYGQICDAFPHLQVGQVHGQMKPAIKEEQMRRFVSGETRILVATTVIEVGVNVPNASVMVIENAERFGLAQLHQLRGRVGRGAEQSYCILVTGYKLSDNTRKRIETMVRTTDGFEIAEADLKLRGPGDLEGTQQSGIAFDLKIANLARDGQILQLARDAAGQVIEADPSCNRPDNSVLWNRLNDLRKSLANWSSIS